MYMAIYSSVHRRMWHESVEASMSLDVNRSFEVKASLRIRQHARTHVSIVVASRKDRHLRAGVRNSNRVKTAGAEHGSLACRHLSLVVENLSR